ncbi:MAG: HAD-IC family P-type ATPase, partial [Actinomycetota bacterium]|nr:HAD-IC family P-type ATPase [Actinomycetota bacterium]
METRDKSVDWHCLEVPEVLNLLGSSTSHGLSEEEAAARLHRYGHNRIREEKPPHPLVIFLDQFQDFMIYVLLAAALVSGLVLREFLDAAVIMFIVVANGILGFIQEYRAEKALESLRKLSAPTARVIREGKERLILSHDLVPGDVILLEAGDRIPADARVLESHGLRADEASLTGESESVEKRPETLRGEDLPLGDRLNMVFTGTHIVHGRGTAVVVETGRKTQLGRIAEMIGEAEEERTPLQRELARTGKRIALLCLAVCAVVFILGSLRGQEWSEMFLFSVSLAVAAIPEGLPAIVTIALALGVRRMAERNALLRRLPAVETLGCADVICTDKTGTLTRNQMEVQEIHVPEKPPLRLTQTESGPVKENPGLQALLATAVLCNDAREQEGEFLGEGTEVGLLRMALDLGFSRENAAALHPRVEEIPFESERKMMSTIHALSEEDGTPFPLPLRKSPYNL